MDEHRIGLKPIVRRIWARRALRPEAPLPPQHRRSQLPFRRVIRRLHALHVRERPQPIPLLPQRRRQLRKQARAKGKTVGKRRLAWCAWTVFITNVPADRLTVAELLTLVRARWQIELLIKRWKSHGTVDESRSQKPYRVLCDVYAKLLAMIVQHWLFLVNLWAYPDRSLVKAAKTIRRRALELARTFRRRTRVIAVIRDS
jgi:hypothetical protein